MRKLISGIFALLTAAMLIAPMSAFADTTINPDPDNMPSPKPGTAGTMVEFSVDPTYTVTIPSTVTLEKGEDDIYTKSDLIKAEGVKLEEGKKIVVTLTSASKFNLAHTGEGEYKLPYTAETVAFGKVNKETGGKVAEFVTSTDEQKVDITFTTDEIPKYAGAYSDPVVFGISVE
ncbi:MAG: hypothetical protein IJ555_02180 [Ruminococcus sp.]|nr:hypothetical protein [Ruminococcus sp.]